MLNTSFRNSQNLSENEKIVHLLKNFPQLTKCLFIHLMWKLELQKYFYDAIRYLSPWIIVNFLNELIDSLRFMKPFDITDEVREVIEAIYFCICRMDYKILNYEKREELKSIISRFVDEFAKALLRNYNTPLTDESITKSKKKLQTYIGYSFNNQLILIHKCFQMYQQKPKFIIDKEFEIFKISENEKEFDNNSRMFSIDYDEALCKLNLAMLNTLQNSLVNITLDDFMYFVEIDIEDNEIEDVDLKRDNLQKSIGEQSYLLIQLIDENECFKHDVSKQLPTISIKPKTLKEIASESTVGTILDKIGTSINRRVWFDEILNRTETLYFNEECLKTVAENSDLLTLRDLKKILRDHIQHEMDDEDEIWIKEIFKVGSKNLEDEEKRDFCEEIIATLGNDYHIVEDTNQELTNYFNQITENSMNEAEMWNLLLLNPSNFYQHLLKDIQNQNETQIGIVLQILKLTISIAKDFHKKIIIESLENPPKPQKSFQHIFLAEIFKNQLIERKEFVREIIMENITKSMSSKDLNLLLLILKTLNLISTKLKLEDFLAPLIIILAQVLDNFRWDLITFTQINETIVEITIEILQNLMKTILINGSQRDRDWIISKTENLKLLTKFYFQKLKLQKGEQIIPFDKFLQPNGFDHMNNSKITSFLCETIVRCTTKELRWLMRNERLQNFLTDTILVITVIVSKSNESKAFNCLHKCVADYVKMMREVIQPPEDKSKLLTDIINIIKKFPTNTFNELSILFLDLLQTLKECENFSTFLSEIEDCELKRILME